MTQSEPHRAAFPLPGYRSRLEHDLKRWHASGWIDRSGVEAIRHELATTRSGPSLAAALAMLGAVSIVFAAISFVAANWSGFPRLLRLAMLVSGLWLAYGGAIWLRARSHPAMAHAAILLGVGLFGAAILLVAQMYHISGNPVDAVWTWALGGLAAGVGLVSGPALALSLGLFQLWTGWTSIETGSVHWAFLPHWALVAAAFAWLRWRPGLHLAALSLAVWIACLGYLLGKGYSHQVVAGIGFVLSMIFVVAGPAIDRWRPISEASLVYAGGLTFAGLFAMQFVDRVPAGRLLGMAILTLGAIVALLAHAWRRGLRVPLWLCYLAFAAEVLALYFKTIGSLLGTSAFFLATGIVLAGLAWLAVRVLRVQLPSGEKAP